MQIGLVTRFQLVAAMLLCFALTTTHGDDKSTQIAVNPNHRRTGSKWLIFGEGMFKTARLGLLDRVVFDEKRNKFVHTTYLIQSEDGLTKMRRWLVENIGPLLNTHRVDNRFEATVWPWRLSVYASDREQEDAVIVTVPLHDVFTGFSERTFQSLVRDWNAVEVKE
jgi:hypothetical protein